MKSYILAGVALIAMSGTGFAADVIAEPTPFDWSGFYIGAHAGYGGSDIDGTYKNQEAGIFDTFADEGEGPFNLSPEGFLGGVQAGANWQNGNLVLGVEGDVSFVDWSDSIFSEGIGREDRVSAKTDFVGTLRGRAGLAMDNFLFFGTAGIALTDTEYKAEDIDADRRGSLDFNDIGFVVGGGAEYAINERWSIKAEGLYFFFNDKEDASNLIDDIDTDGDKVELNDAWMARIGVNFHL